MNIVLLGLGQQGYAALYDIVKFSEFTKIIAVDLNTDAVKLAKAKFSDKRVDVRCLDISDKVKLSNLLKEYKPGLIIDLLPIKFISQVARISIEEGWHYVNTYYTLDSLRELEDAANSNELAILPEFGLDPGIDLVMAGEGLRSLNRVSNFFSYGGGLPESEACTNPLKYKISWLFEGVLNSYYRPAKLIHDGELAIIEPDEIFNEKWKRIVEIRELGSLEGFPNGDVTKYIKLANLKDIMNAGRYALRWPGHNEFWYKIAKLGLLEDRIVHIDDIELSQRKVMARLFEPGLKYEESERDLTILLVEIVGEKEGRSVKLTYKMLDYRDLETGFMSMNRTVGFVASIGAQMIHEGSIKKRGLLSPLLDVPYAPFVDKLKQRNIRITCEESLL